jgi:hypothetical protein
MLLNEDVFEEVRKPSKEQKEKALRIHCFVVEKRDGRIKARAVADGRTQKRYLERKHIRLQLNWRVLCSTV